MWPTMNFKLRVEYAAEEHAYDLRGGVDREAPGGTVEPWIIVQVIGVVRLHHRRMRRSGMQVDWHIQTLRARVDRPELL
jgi:hypothetical protein